MIKSQAGVFPKLWKFLVGRHKSATPLTKPFRLVLTFYLPDGFTYSMPIACLSAYVKREFPGIEVHLVAINTTLGDRVEGYVKRVADLQPDLVGVSCMSLHWFPLLPYLDGLKAAQPEVPILLGGYQAILSPDETISYPAIDFVCVGDGEYPLQGLIQRIRQGSSDVVPGLWEKKVNGEVVKTAPVLTEDLTTLPFPDYTIYERDGQLEKVSNLGVGTDVVILPVMTGRGCPYRCTYCSNASMLETYSGKGSYLRKYDAEAMVEELCRLRDRYGVGYFEFWDELFLSNMKYVYHFLELYKKHLAIPFAITSRVEKMDETFCRTARDAGCHAVWFGIESGSESYRHKYLNRKMTNEQIIQAAENARKAGIRRLTFNLVGMPFETRENMLETLELNKLIQPDVFHVYPFMPLRGTALYNLAEQEGLLLDQQPSDFGASGRSGRFKMNLKQHEGSVTPDEFNEICHMMEQYKQEAFPGNYYS